MVHLQNTYKIHPISCHPFIHSHFCYFNHLLLSLMGEGNGTPLQYSCLENPMNGGAWWAAVHRIAELDTTEWLHFHVLEKEMATHSSVLAWRIPGTGDPGGLLSMGSHRVGHDWSDLAAAALSLILNMAVKGILLKPRADHVSSFQLLSCVRLCVTPWTAARQASLFISNPWSLHKLTSIESAIPSNLLMFCCALLLLSSIFPSIRVFSNESVLYIRWSKY